MNRMFSIHLKVDEVDDRCRLKREQTLFDDMCIIVILREYDGTNRKSLCDDGFVILIYMLVPTVWTRTLHCPPVTTY